MQDPALLEERIAALEAAMRPQRLAETVSRAWDPKGQEPRIVDADGVTLDYEPAVQLMGGTSTIDPVTQRVIYTPTAANAADLRWTDTFSADMAAYRDVFNLTAGGSALSWNPATGNGGWAVKTGAWYNTVQAIQITQHSSNTGTVALLARLRNMPSSAGIRVRWDTGTGVLDVYDDAAGAIVATSATTYAATNEVPRYLVMSTQADRVRGAVVTVAPSGIVGPAHILADVSYTMPDGTAHPYVLDGGVGFDVLVFGAPIMTLTDYRIWHP